MAFGSIYTRVAAGVLGLLSGGAAARAVRPIFELVEQEAWHNEPNLLLGPNDLAAIVATALADLDDVTDAAQRQGLTRERLRALVLLAMRTPTIGQAMEARRRDLIGDEQYRHVLRKAGIEPQYDAAMFELLEVLPPATDLVRMAVREAFSPEQVAALDLDAEFPEEFATRAAKLGLSRDTAKLYWRAHWDLPSFEQLAHMHFRIPGFGRDELSDALRAIDIAPVWRDRFLAIARTIPTPTDFLRLVRRGIYSDERQEFNLDAEYPAVFTEKMALHGMVEQDAKDLWAGGWRLPSAGQLYRMLWRHEISPAQLNAGLKALDYPPFWRQRLASVARPVPPRVAISTMLRRGVLEAAEGHELFMQLGYSDEHADKLVQIALPEAAGAADASTWLGRARTQLWTAMHKAFIAERLSADEVAAGFAALGVPEGERPTILTLWAQEATVPTAGLTRTQVKALYKKTTWTYDRALAELEQLGMDSDDADTLLTL